MDPADVGSPEGKRENPEASRHAVRKWQEQGDRSENRGRDDEPAVATEVETGGGVEEPPADPGTGCADNHQQRTYQNQAAPDRKQVRPWIAPSRQIYHHQQRMAGTLPDVQSSHPFNKRVLR